MSRYKYFIFTKGRMQQYYFPFGICAMIFGGIANVYCGTYYVFYHRNAGLSTKLTIMLIFNDILTCSAYLWFASEGLQMKSVENSLAVLMYSTFASNSGWITLTMSALRCCLTISPLYVVNKKCIYTVLCGGTFANFTFLTTLFHLVDILTYQEYSCVYFLVILIVITAFSVVMTVTLCSKSQTSISPVVRKAAITVSLIALIYIITTMPMLVAVITWNSHLMTDFVTVFVPLSGVLNPMVYISRKKQLLTFCCNVRKRDPRRASVQTNTTGF